MDTLDLNGIWQLRSENGTYASQAYVPGSILTDLLREGQIDDPFYRDNERQAIALSYLDFRFSRSFEADRTLLEHEYVELVCQGLDTLATVTVNGVVALEADNMHRTWRTDIREFLHPGTNTIEVLIHSPSRAADERLAESGVNFKLETVHHGCHTIRKAHSMYGWDWGPNMPDGGIWRPIHIEAYSHARIDRVQFIQEHGDDAVRVQGHVVLSHADVRCAYTAELRLEDDQGRVYAQTGDIGPSGGRTEAVVTEPRLWWARGYGEQHLYCAVVTLTQDGRIVDRIEYRLGLRTLEVSRQEDEWGREFCFRLNGVKIFAMGANVIPEDSLTGRLSQDRTRRLLEDCAAANFNSLRVWGGGYYPDDTFYDICDELGLIVWQDFMFACNIYEFSEAFLESVRQEAVDNIRRLRHHASLGMWCGNNEIEVAWIDWHGTRENNEPYYGQYAGYFERLLPAIVEEEDPQRFYWPSSPSSGSVAMERPQDESRGDAHYWDVWHGGKPFTDYRTHFFRFLSEYGFQSFPDRKTVDSFTEPGDRNVFSYVMEVHQKNPSANGKILFYLAENYRYPDSLDGLIYISQLLQAEAMRYCVEHMRRHRGRCMGSYYWQLNDCWPVASWASIDNDGRWKALHYKAGRMYAPVLLSCEDTDTAMRLHVANETMEAFSGTVIWSVRDNRSAVLAEGRAEASVAALSGQYACTLDLGEYFASVEQRQTRYFAYELYEGDRPVSGGTLTVCPAKHFRFADPALEASAEDRGNAFAIRLTARAYAQGVCLRLRIADAVFSDNWFDMHAGREVCVTVDKHTLPETMTAAGLLESLELRSVYA